MGPVILLTRLIISPFTGFKNIFSQNIWLGQFGVHIESPCSGLQWAFFFAAIFSCFWIYYANKGPVRHRRAAWALAGGIILLFILNALRIALLLLVGSVFSPSISIELFHSLLGVVLSFFVFLGYVQWVLPWIIEPENTK